MGPKNIIVSREGRVGLITLNNPSKMNPINSAVEAEIRQVLDGWEDDSEVRCIVITGSGRAFSSGVDRETLRAAHGLSPYGVYEDIDRTTKLIYRLNTYPKPTIAAINGLALGLGLDLAMACDLRVASDEASMGAIFVKIGLSSDSGSSYLLTRLVGLSKALELLLTGDIIPAQQAKEIGLVNKVFSAEDFQQATLEMAKRIANHSPVAVRFLKATVYKSINSDLDAVMEFESATQALVMHSPEHRQAVQEFLKKGETH
jgi:2-(1,2-epoxy-1,2-dihydrophenyl)acetyl-CoA isomerase